MAVQSPHVCCRGQSGKHLLGMSISHFDPERSLCRRQSHLDVQRLKRRDTPADAIQCPYCAVADVLSSCCEDGAS